MAHRCIHCSAIYLDGAKEILEGCTCGSRFFFYITAEKMAKLQGNKEEIQLSTDEKEQIEKDVREIIGVEEDEVPIVLDFESVRVLKPGKYVIDLHRLFDSKKPLVYTLEDGKYIIDLASQIPDPRHKNKTI